MKTNIFSFTGVMLIFALSSPAMAQDVILPHRVIEFGTGSVVDFEQFLFRCSQAAVVTLGENHEDPATHRVELAVLQGLFRYKHDLVLSMEMFERDVQNVLDDYLAGKIDENQFLTSSRPWGNYETDYRPLVEFAKEYGLPVVAANIPRYLAHKVAEQGFHAVEWQEEERLLVPSKFEAPEDAYWEAFHESMKMAAAGGMRVTEDTMRFYYEAQVVKDETMAESILRALASHPTSTVLHITGAFHTADYLGTFARVKRDAPDIDAVSVIIEPVPNLLEPLPEDTPAADYIILVLAPQEEKQETTTASLPQEETPQDENGTQ